jgi:hypothetical protein
LLQAANAVDRRYPSNGRSKLSFGQVIDRALIDLGKQINEGMRAHFRLARLVRMDRGDRAVDTIHAA